jgi:transmembrane sensor
MMQDPDQLFEGWLSGTLSKEEVDLLLERLREGEADSPWPIFINQLMQDPGLAGEGNGDQRERLFQQIMERGRGSEQGKQRLLRVFRWAAAAMLILLAVSGYWIYHSFPAKHGLADNSGQAIKKDLLPGSNKAILTLGNGSTIILDSSRKGQLAQQSGATIFKSDNGQISYKADVLSDHSIVYNTLTTPRGGQYKLLLPDGTGVWLNAASSITYPTAFTGKERTVQVTGEVYFEVAKNTSMPFRVQVKQMEVSVLGTHFDINAYDEESSINTTLLEGAVKVSEGDRQELLQPGQQARLAGNGPIKILPGVDLDAVMAWKNGFFSFHHTDLQTVMRELARWYDVSIEYRGDIPDMKFGGDISRSANASQVLHILEESKIHFTIEGKKIIVTP